MNYSKCVSRLHALSGTRYYNHYIYSCTNFSKEYDGVIVLTILRFVGLNALIDSNPLIDSVIRPVGMYVECSPCVRLHAMMCSQIQYLVYV